MTEPLSATHQYLLPHYGPLLTFKHLAEVMYLSPNGVRMAIARKRQPLAVALGQARRQLGRRVYFEARVVAEAIDHCRTIPTEFPLDNNRLADRADKDLTTHEKFHGGI
ncbi:MAG: hypothetical protein K8I04_00215 [Gammaproteobacteria bacterium]|nr:hypothetical protein [Gammaproteobacteria bacterium]